MGFRTDHDELCGEFATEEAVFMRLVGVAAGPTDSEDKRDYSRAVSRAVNRHERRIARYERRGKITSEQADAARMELALHVEAVEAFDFDIDNLAKLFAMILEFIKALMAIFAVV